MVGDKEPQFPPPHYSPEEAARVILSAAEKPIRTAYVGGAARLFGSLAAVAPKAVDWISEKILMPGQISESPVTRTDNLHQGKAEAHTTGEARPGPGRPSLYSVAARNPVATVAVAGGIAAGAFLLTRRRPEPPHLLAGAKRDGEVAESPPLEGV